MSSEENKAIMLRYIEEAWNKGDWQVAEEVIAEDAVFHDMVREGQTPAGREGVRAGMERFRTAFPDFRMDIHDIIAEGDKVVLRWSAVGTHTGDFNGIPPTNRSTTLYAMSIVRMEDGRIVEGWQEVDRLGLAEGLGLMPKGKMPRPMASAMALRVRVADRLSRRG